MKEHKISVDLIQTHKNPTIRVKTGDIDSNRFLFTVLHGGEVYDLTDTTVSMAVNKPDSLLASIVQGCTITDAENGQCEAIVPSTAYDEEGHYVGELRITKGGTVATTYQFEYVSLQSL